MTPQRQTSNPVLSPSAFTYRGAIVGERMTVQGTINKTAFLLALVVLSAMYTWNQGFRPGSNVSGLMTLGLFGGLGFGFATCFKPNWAPITAPLYALSEGLALGGVSALYEARFHGIAIQAVLLTSATLLAMLGAYTLGIIRASDTFKRGVIAATGGIFLFYLVTMVLGMFGVHLGVFGNGALGLGVSIVVVIVAALNLVLDFDMIEQGSRYGAPKFMEWYGGFGLLVTLVWLYVEILRLLAILASRRD